MAKNPLWVLENLLPTIQEFCKITNNGMSLGDYDGLHFWLESWEMYQESVSVPYFFRWLCKEVTERHEFVRYALDTIPRNSVAYHALLDFMRYYGA